MTDHSYSVEVFNFVNCTGQMDLTTPRARNLMLHHFQTVYRHSLYFEQDIDSKPHHKALVWH